MRITTRDIWNNCERKPYFPRELCVNPGKNLISDRRTETSSSFLVHVEIFVGVANCHISQALLKKLCDLDRVILVAIALIFWH